jgi:histidinol-phosphate aminotransferase
MYPNPRPDLNDLPPYRAGQKLVAAPGQTVYKLSSNENPYAPISSVVEAITKAALEINRYPDPMATELVQAIADDLGVLPENVAVGDGSVAVLGHLFQAMCAPGDSVIYPWRSFEAYPIWSQISVVNSVPVSLFPDGSVDLSEVHKKIDQYTRIILVCTPNNPTGTSVKATDLHALMREVPDNVLVIVDEAYAEFVTSPDAVNGMDFFNMYGNIAVLRTFSKAQGLAGLRVGYVIAQPNVIDFVRRVSIPFGVSNIAQAAAVASLQPEAKAELKERVVAIVAERDRVEAAVRATGWDLPPMQANFIWIQTAKSGELKAACEAEGVAVRQFPEGVRITIGEPAANDRMIKVLSAFLQ